MKRYLIAALAAVALAGCDAEAFKAPPDFEFVCMKDGVESLRMRAVTAQMYYEPRTQVEHWDLGVVDNNREHGGYHHESGLHEVCGPLAGPPDPIVD